MNQLCLLQKQKKVEERVESANDIGATAPPVVMVGAFGVQLSHTDRRVQNPTDFSEQLSLHPSIALLVCSPIGLDALELSYHLFVVLCRPRQKPALTESLLQW
jgi:hypothetical protein